MAEVWTKRYLPATRTDRDSLVDTVVDTDDAHDADRVADYTVALAAAETVAVAGIAVPDASDVDVDVDVDADADADDDAAGDTRHDCNHPYHNEVTFPVHNLGRILSSRWKREARANGKHINHLPIGPGRSIVVFRILFRMESPTSHSRRTSAYLSIVWKLPLSRLTDGSANRREKLLRTREYRLRVFENEAAWLFRCALRPRALNLSPVFFFDHFDGF